MANTGRLIEMVEIDMFVDGQWSKDRIFIRFWQSIE